VRQQLFGSDVEMIGGLGGGQQAIGVAPLPMPAA